MIEQMSDNFDNNLLSLLFLSVPMATCICWQTECLQRSLMSRRSMLWWLLAILRKFKNWDISSFVEEQHQDEVGLCRLSGGDSRHSCALRCGEFILVCVWFPNPAHSNGSRLGHYHCSHMGPHLESRVPMGTFFSFWVPLGPHFLF